MPIVILATGREAQKQQKSNPKVSGVGLAYNGCQML